MSVEFANRGARFLLECAPVRPPVFRGKPSPEQRRDLAQAQWLHDAIVEGLPSGQAIELFRSACNRVGTLFAPSHWLRFRLLRIGLRLSPHLSAEEAEMLRDVLRQVVQIDDAIKWIGTTEPWTEYKRRIEQQRAEDAKKALPDDDCICGASLLFSRQQDQIDVGHSLPRDGHSVEPSFPSEPPLESFVSEGLELLRTGLTETFSGHFTRIDGDIPAILDRLSDDWEAEGDSGQLSSVLIREIQTAQRLKAGSLEFDARSAYRVLDSVERVLTLIGAPQAARADHLRLHLLKKVVAEASPATLDNFPRVDPPPGLPSPPEPPEPDDNPAGPPARVSQEPMVALAFQESEYLILDDSGDMRPSDGLAALLLGNREKYAWRDTPAGSQGRIIELEDETSSCVRRLDDEPNLAYSIAMDVSEWGGNRRREEIRKDAAGVIRAAIQFLLDGEIFRGLRLLTEQHGLDLVMATKVFRFVQPEDGAALDRHTSYFFNSLELRDLTQSQSSQTARYCTEFKREWSTGKHRASRLACYSPSYRQKALTEYCDRYLPALRQIAASMNQRGMHYVCAATRERTSWRPADVEMAAYQYWSGTTFK